jgi:hypothetical protein
VGNLGDLNNDGVVDIGVGAFQDDDGGTGNGAVYILFLKTNGKVQVTFTMLLTNDFICLLSAYCATVV